MRVTGRRTPGLLGLLALLGLTLVLPGCAGRKKVAETVILSPEQGYERALDLLARRKLRAAIEALGKIDLTSLENRTELEPRIRLALADATFYQGNDIGLIDARSLYLDFVSLFGEHALAPYAQFQAGMCSLLQMSHPSKDQTETLGTISALAEVHRRYPTSRWSAAARLMRMQAETSLAEHEYLIGRFYFKKKAYLAAVDRFRRVLDSAPPYFEREKVYYDLGRALVLGNNPAEGRIYLDKLVQDFPQGRFAGQARKFLSSAPPADEGVKLGG